MSRRKQLFARRLQQSGGQMPQVVGVIGKKWPFLRVSASLGKRKRELWTQWLAHPAAGPGGSK